MGTSRPITSEQFLKAAQMGAVDTLGRYIAENLGNDNALRVRTSDGNGNMATHLAVAGNQLQALSTLLSVAALSPNLMSHKGNTILHEAVKSRNQDVLVKVLAIPGIDFLQHNTARKSAAQLAEDMDLLNFSTMIINAHAESRQTASAAQAIATISTEEFLAAAYRNNLAILKYFIAQNQGQLARLNAADGHGNTALHLASAEGHQDAVSILLAEPGINANAINRAGDSPLHVAARARFFNIINRLLAKKYISFSENASGDTPGKLVGNQDAGAMVKRLIDRFSILLTTSAQNSRASTFLTHTLDGNIPEIRAYLEENKDDMTALHVVNADGHSAMHLSLGLENFEDVKNNLISGLLNPNARNNYGRTALHEAVLLQEEAAVTSMADDRLFDLEALDGVGNTPLGLARRVGGRNIINILEQAEKKRFAESQVVGKKARQEPTTGVQAPIQPRLEPYEIFLMAAESGDTETVDKYLGQPKRMTEQLSREDKLGRNALHLAALAGHTAIVEKLLQAGFDPNAWDLTRNTALHYAASKGHIEIVTKLLNEQFLTDFSTRNEQGCSAAQEAVANGHAEVAALIQAALAKKAAAKLRLSFQERLDLIGFKGSIPLKIVCIYTKGIIKEPIISATGFQVDRMQHRLAFQKVKKGERVIRQKAKCLITEQEISVSELAYEINITVKEWAEAFVAKQEKRHKELLVAHSVFKPVAVEDDAMAVVEEAKPASPTLSRSPDHVEN